MQQLTGGGSKSEVLFVGIVVLSGAGLVLWGFSLEGGRPTIHPPQLAQFHPSRTPSYDNQTKLPNEDNTELPCTKWAIVSLLGPPIPPPPPWPHWCLLVLIDSAMPLSPPLKRVKILDSSWKRLNCTFHLCSLIPWHAEKRRTLGYLFAIQLGATVLLDLEPGSFLEVGAGPEKLDEGRVEVRAFQNSSIFLPEQVIYPATRMWNPYLHMTDIIKEPPGFPPSYDALNQQVLTSHMEELGRERVGMVQPLGHDPSLRTFPLLALALKTAAPMWGGALYKREAFLTLLLPPSLTSMKARLWRGFIGQRILWLMGRHLAFARPWALLEENQAEEKEDEWNVEETSALEALQQMNLECEAAGDCLMELWVEMNKGGLLTSEDLNLVSTWLEDLKTTGYTMTPITDRSQKQFAYLVQGGKAGSMAGLQKKLGMEMNMDVYTLTFLEPSGDLYYPNSTHLGGRNALLRYALSMERGPGYQYFIFIDEDVELRVVDTKAYAWKDNMERHPWRRFEDFLSTFQPKVGFPQYSRWKQADPRGPYSITSTADSCLNAFHRSTLQFGLPYHETLLEQLSLSFSAVTRFFKMKATYQSAMYQCNALRSVNGGNKYHGRGDQKKKPKHSQMIEKILDAKHIGKKKVRSVLIQNLNESLPDNKLVFLLDALLKNCCVNKERKKAFGQLQLFKGKMGLSDPSGQFGRSFLPEMLKFLNPCGVMVRYQVLWWKSPLLASIVKPIKDDLRAVEDYQCSQQ